MTTQTALSPTQTLILGTAARRRTHLILPLPDECRLVGGTRTRVLTVLVQRGLVTGAAAARAARWRAWRSASVIGLSPIDLRGMVPLRSVTSRNPQRTGR